MNSSINFTHDFYSPFPFEYIYGCIIKEILEGFVHLTIIFYEYVRV